MPNLIAKIQHTRPVSEIEVNKSNAILVAGCQAPMFAFQDATSLYRTFVEFYEAGKISTAVCDGVALRYVRLRNGELLAKGKTVTGFADAEEDYPDNAAWELNLLQEYHALAYRRRGEEDRRKLRPSRSLAQIRDGNLITGQQNYSGPETAKVLIKALGE
jgi:putative intracellular protease/amidase